MHIWNDIRLSVYPNTLCLKQHMQLTNINLFQYLKNSNYSYRKLAYKLEVINTLPTTKTPHATYHPQYASDYKQNTLYGQLVCSE